MYARLTKRLDQLTTPGEVQVSLTRGGERFWAVTVVRGKGIVGIEDRDAHTGPA